VRTFVGNGKQALTLVARTLRARGARTVLTPWYRCEAMAVPFALEGMRVLPVDVGTDLLLDPRALIEALDRDPGAAVVHCETYGNRGGQELTSALAIARMRGSAVILDATHSLVDRLLATAASPGTAGGITGRSEPWDALVASARKLLPVPDGAWLAWSESSSLAKDLGRAVAELPEREAVDEHCAALGIELGRVSEAMRASLGSRREELRIQICAIADRHERAIETALAPVPASARTIALLETLDPEVLQLRARTARRLRERLAAGLRACGLRVVNPGSAGCVALSAVIRNRDEMPANLECRKSQESQEFQESQRRRSQRALDEVEEALTRSGLWGPVSWPDPGAGVGTPPWPRVVTVPTDDPGRMHELSDVVGTALGEGAEAGAGRLRLAE